MTLHLSLCKISVPFDKSSKNGEDETNAKRKYESDLNFDFEPKANPEEILSKKPKIDILTHFQTIIDDPKHVICITCSSKLSTYSLKSLKKHLSTQKHLKIEEKNNSLKMKVRSLSNGTLSIIDLRNIMNYKFLTTDLRKKAI